MRMERKRREVGKRMEGGNRKKQEWGSKREERVREGGRNVERRK